ncbi:MAG TPA: AI-2E family transporter [Candidatus Limnocylindria bacterium]|jgi:predicted PurR-regulated permease PerM
MAEKTPRPPTPVAVTTPPGGDKDIVESLQESDLSRWSPRRAGIPALLDWWPSYFAMACVAVLVFVATARALLDALVPLAHLIVVFGFAAALTFSIAPLVARLEDRMPRSAAVALAFAGILVVFAGLVALVVRPLADQGQNLADQITAYGDALQGKRALVIGDIVLPTGIQDRVREFMEKNGPALAERSSGAVVAFLTLVIDLVLVLVLTFYLLLDARRFRVIVLRALQTRHRGPVRRIFVEMARVFGAYVRGQIIVALSLFAMVSLALTIIGVPFALFLGAFAGLVELVPMIGPFAGALPALLLAAPLGGPTLLWTAISFLVIQQIESNVLVPRVVGRAVGLHPVAAILALLAGFEVGGVVGALFAVPIAGLIWVFVGTAVFAWRGRRFDLQRVRDRRRQWRPRRRRPITPPPA